MKDKRNFKYEMISASSVRIVPNNGPKKKDRFQNNKAKKQTDNVVIRTLDESSISVLQNVRVIYNLK